MRALSVALVDATVQPRNVVFLTDARLLHQATTILAHLARKQDVAIRQVYVRVAKRARLMIKRYAHAKRSEEHTSELQSLMRISYAVCCLNKKIHRTNNILQPQP